MRASNMCVRATNPRFNPITQVISSGAESRDEGYIYYRNHPLSLLTPTSAQWTSRMGTALERMFAIFFFFTCPIVSKSNPVYFSTALKSAHFFIPTNSASTSWFFFLCSLFQWESASLQHRWSKIFPPGTNQVVDEWLTATLLPGN